MIRRSYRQASNLYVGVIGRNHTPELWSKGNFFILAFILNESESETIRRSYRQASNLYAGVIGRNHTPELQANKQNLTPELRAKRTVSGVQPRLKEL